MQSHNLQYAPARYVLHFFHFVKEQPSNNRQPKLPFQEVRDEDTYIVISDCSNTCARVLVELVGIEPTTYGLQSRRSPS